MYKDAQSKFLEAAAGLMFQETTHGLASAT
jgi:hypothetical protein